jgi:hypothetical protein
LRPVARVMSGSSLGSVMRSSASSFMWALKCWKACRRRTSLREEPVACPPCVRLRRSDFVRRDSHELGRGGCPGRSRNFRQGAGRIGRPRGGEISDRAGDGNSTFLKFW